MTVRRKITFETGEREGRHSILLFIVSGPTSRTHTLAPFHSRCWIEDTGWCARAMPGTARQGLGESNNVTTV